MRAAAFVLAGLLTVLPTNAFAWGFTAHRFITEQMIALLPAELRPFFESRRAFIIERSVDPDLWRTAGWEEEPPNHFLDMDYREFGPYPFDALPRDYDRAVQKFGKDVIDQQGRVPWRAQEFFGKLRRSFEDAGRRPPGGYALDNIAYFAAILSHYVADAHVPLHAVVNYDGQLTNQRGLHSRWEAELFERLQGRLRVTPAPAAAVADPRDFIFEVLLRSNRLAEGVLADDRAAAEGRAAYDDAYFEAFARTQGPVLEGRLNDSITAVASMITGAWEAAGRPAVPLTRDAPPRRTPGP
ncbi:MAG: hypothetical protein AB7O67_09335 [Vicinamibacterales bacterium]